MKLKTTAISLCLLILFSSAVTKAQEKTGSTAITPAEEDEIACALRITTSIVNISFSVWSSEKGYLKNLTAKDFEIYDRDELQEIDSITFDELENRYFIRFYEKDSAASSEKHDVKVKVKLPEQSRKDYGEISILLQ